MARSPAEIQADIALTRRVIEHQLDALSRRVPNPHWVPWLAVAGGFGVWLLLARVPLLRLVSVAARTAQAAIAVDGTVAAVDRFLADRHQREA